MLFSINNTELMMRFANLSEFEASFYFFFWYKFNPTMHSRESLLRFFPRDPADHHNTPGWAVASSRRNTFSLESVVQSCLFNWKRTIRPIRVVMANP